LNSQRFFYRSEVATRELKQSIEALSAERDALSTKSHDQSQSIDTMNLQLSETTAQLQSTSVTLSERTAQRDHLSGQVEHCRTEIQSLQAQLHGVEAELSTAKVEISALQQSEKQAKADAELALTAARAAQVVCFGFISSVFVIFKNSDFSICHYRTRFLLHLHFVLS
jgi:chromosome segregation ATPase